MDKIRVGVIGAAGRGSGFIPTLLAHQATDLTALCDIRREEEFLPDHWRHPPAEALAAGHGGGDYWEVQDFVAAIREEKEPAIGIDLAMDMTLPGLVSQQSVAQGAAWVAVPDSRNWT